jgi:hypothetical protein
MKYILSLVFAAFIAVTATSQTAPETAETPAILDGASVNLDEFLWLKRPLVIFADTPNDPRFIQQIEILTERLSVLESRDVVVITDTDPAEPSDLRRRLRPRGFMLVLVGKDGVIHLRKPVPWQVREITRTIDSLPERRQELRDRPSGRS